MRLSFLLSFLLFKYEIAARMRRPRGPHEMTRDGTPRIVGGHDALLGDNETTRYPYLVSLQTTFPSIAHRCGGSLIAPDVVLSAAHCYANVDAIAVRTKPHRLDDPIAGSKIFAVKASIRHPEYGLVTGIDKDFWVLKLEGNSTLPLLRLNDSPELPLLYESLTVAGWGTTQSGENVPPDVLQFTNQSIYISNEECVGVTIGGPQQEYNSTASTTVTRDMLCALEVDQGACQGDSGGPLIRKGNKSEEDLQVGVVSWGAGCGVSTSPGVYARLSWGYEFIRTQVCSMSDAPPEYFLCNATIGSPAPSGPTLPTVSPAPSAALVPVLIQVRLDGFPFETSWRIETSRGEVVYEVPVYSYMEKSVTVSEVVALESGEQYTFVLMDMFADGICCPRGEAFVFYGNSSNHSNVLAYLDGDFKASTNATFKVSPRGLFALYPPTSPPSGSFAPSGSSSPSFLPSTTQMPTNTLQKITLLINFDTYSSVSVSWSISTFDGKVVNETSVGKYGPFDGDVVTESIALQVGRDYVFTIRDAVGDGICCKTGEGYVEIYLGTDVSGDKVLLYDRGDFGFERAQNFSVSDDSSFIATQSPSAAPSASHLPSRSLVPTSSFVIVVVQIRFDLFTHETGWAITSVSGDVLASAPPGEYSSFGGGSIMNATVSVAVGKPHIFTLVDSLGDGMCCNFGDGYAIVYFEEVSDDNVLMYMNGFFQSERTGAFLASADGIVKGFSPAVLYMPTSAPSKFVTEFPTTTVSPSMRPTTTAPSFSLAPSSSPSISLIPSQSAYPTAMSVVVSVVLTLDFYSKDTGFVILRAGTNEPVAESPPGSLVVESNVSSSTIKRDVTLDNTLGTEYVFGIFDVFGDGICCNYGLGRVIVYLGSESDDNVLVYDDGRFGVGALHPFTASHAGVIKEFTLSPSLTPVSPSLSISPTFSLSNNVANSPMPSEAGPNATTSQPNTPSPSKAPVSEGGRSKPTTPSSGTITMIWGSLLLSAYTGLLFCF